MPMIFFIKLDGEPVPKGRPRFTRYGKPYTPEKTARYEKNGKMQAKIKWGVQPLIDRPIACAVTARLPIPKSWSKRKKLAAESGQVPHVGRPDVDNFVKIALDILNETVIKDDSIITTITAEKKYSAEPSLIIKIYESDSIGSLAPLALDGISSQNPT